MSIEFVIFVISIEAAPIIDTPVFKDEKGRFKLNEIGSPPTINPNLFTLHKNMTASMLLVGS